ncbi:MAG: nucleotidyltransferase domain-containing protein, partial [Betaproteobacteria bacterium]
MTDPVAASASPAASGAAAAPRWRSELRAGREVLRAAFAARPDTPVLLRGHSRLVDKVVREVWVELGAPAEIALIAVGGYGRGQLFPHSDVDLLILLAAAPDIRVTSFMERLVGM